MTGFCTFAYANSARKVQEVVGPGLSSLEGPLVNNPFKNLWMPYMVASPALFYATLYTAAVHRDAMFKTGMPQDSLILKSQTINIINENLRDSIPNIPDGTIAASMVIMYTEVRNVPSKTVKPRD
jgi:hypothetical protein